MKKFFMLFVCAFFVFGVLSVFVFEKNDVIYSKFAKAETYKVYITSMSELEESFDDAQIVDLGFCYEVTSSNKIETKRTSKTLGETTTFCCSKSSINRMLAQNGIRVEKRYEVSDCLVFEGTRKNSLFNSQKVQVAYRAGRLSIGIPAILGSY